MEKSPEISLSVSDANGTQPGKKQEKKEEEKTGKITKRQLKILISLIYGSFCLGSCYSLMAPFFPAEAERKNASPTSYGLVFGIYQLSMFIASPIYGKLIPKLTPAFMMKAGMFTSGVCVISFGALEYSPPGPVFIYVACIVRFIDALGSSAFYTASFTTLGLELPGNIGKAMSYTEAAYASGLALGPVIGGAFFSLGGFKLPFIVVGGLLFIGTGVNIVLFSGDDREVLPQTMSVIKLLSSIDFLIDVIVICTCFLCLGFNEATLEPHIRQFSLTPLQIGLVFLISGVLDAVMAPVWGWAADKLERHAENKKQPYEKQPIHDVSSTQNVHWITLLGIILFVLCFLIIGPISIMPFSTNLPVVIVSQFLMGFGMSAEIVCSFTHGMQHTVKRGFGDNVGTYSLVSGIIVSAACLGAFIGPSVGGFMIDTIGYIHATETIVIMKIIVGILCFGRLLVTLTRKKKTVNGDAVENGNQNSQNNKF